MLRLEYYRSWSIDDPLAAAMEKEHFIDLISRGMPAEAALHKAVEFARESVKEKQTKGQKERERRRTYRKAVTEYRGAHAVTTGLVQDCIICGGPLRLPGFAAYCSNACRQKAYRGRRKSDQSR
jgi:hypothetical protein